MPTSYYAISSGTNHWIKTIDKVNNTYAETSFVNQVLEYTSTTAAQADCDWLANLTGIDKFHVLGSPKPH